MICMVRVRHLYATTLVTDNHYIYDSICYHYTLYRGQGQGWGQACICYHYTLSKGGLLQYSIYYIYGYIAIHTHIVYSVQCIVYRVQCIFSGIVYITPMLIIRHSPHYPRVAFSIIVYILYSSIVYITHMGIIHPTPLQCIACSLQ